MRQCISAVRNLVPVLLTVVVSACGAGESGGAATQQLDNSVRWTLPPKLREVSGLALTHDQRLLAVSDEEAIVYEYDYQHGTLVKAFAFGEPTVRDDFEGIAVLNGTVWLLNSSGDLYAAAEGADGERVPYRKHNVGDNCEFEGLAADAEQETLLLLCKDANKKKNRSLVTWAIGGEAQYMQLPEASMSTSIGTRRVHPSGIEIDPVSGNLFVVASREHAVFALSRDGEFLGVIMRLDEDRHRQAEGITILRDGRLIIADEANKGSAMLTIYAPEQFLSAGSSSKSSATIETD